MTRNMSAFGLGAHESDRAAKKAVEEEIPDDEPRVEAGGEHADEHSADAVSGDAHAGDEDSADNNSAEGASAKGADAEDTADAEDAATADARFADDAADDAVAEAVDEAVTDVPDDLEAAARADDDTAPEAAPEIADEPAPTLDVDAFAEPTPITGAIDTEPQRQQPRRLRNMSEIRHYFRTNTSPVFFVGPSAFNLLGLDRWVRGFSYISYYDSWVGTHPRVFSPIEKPYIEFESGEEINNWLLRNHEVRAHVTRMTPPGERPKIVSVFFDEETESICRELGYDLILPSAALRERLDSKIVTTQLANEADVPSVPNVLATVSSWDEVVSLTEEHGLGQDLVIQTAYGDSGKTTYFVTNEAEFDALGDAVLGVEVKIMKRINNRPIAVEAVLTRHGAVVGPCMTEVTGFRELTPYRGGWAGNEMYPGVLGDSARHRATDLVRRLGERLKQEGYRGFFEVDLLLDTDTDELYLGELNPRISGASAITNVTSGAYADVPLFAFHLLEYSGVEFDLDVDEINERWEQLASEDEWCHMVIKQTSDLVEYINTAPPTGRYVLDVHGRLVFSHGDLDWHLLHNENEAFYLRIYGPGDYRWKGADLGILVTRGRLQTTDGTLSIRARHFIQSIRAMYVATPIATRATVETGAK